MTLWQWFVCCVLLAQALPISARAGLVGHYAFEAGSGISVADDSPEGNHGSLVGAPATPTWIDGAVAGALHFAGAGARVLVPDSASLDLTGPFSLAAWIRPDLTGTQYVIKKARHGVSDGFELSLSSDGFVFLRINQASAGNALRIESTTLHPADGSTWMHVSAMFDGDRLFLYLNGEFEASLAVPGLAVGLSDEPLIFGGELDGTGPYMGALDEVYLFDHAISEDELHALPGVPAASFTPATPPPDPAALAALAAASGAGSGSGGPPTPSSEALSGARQLFVQQGTDCTLPYPICGTEASPFDDIDLCAEALQAGETCWVMDGFYYMGIDDRDGSPYEPLRSGTASEPIAFRAYPGHSPTISAAPGVTWNFGIRSARHYITYDGFRIQGVLRIHGSSEGSRATGITVENCEIWEGGGKDDGNWSGIFAEFVEDLTIRNTVIRSTRSPSGGSAKGISLFNGRRTIVENNLLYDHPSEGVFDKEGGEDNVYRRNVLWNNKVGLKINNQGDSLGVENERTQIYQNVFVCLGEGLDEAIRLLHQPTDYAVYNNTGFECGGIVVRSSSGPADGGVVYNNIWWSSRVESTMWESQNGDDREPDYLDYNLYAPGGTYRENRYTSESDTFYSLSEWRSVPHPRWYDQNSAEGDPLFVDPDVGNFQLAAGSPAIGAGLYAEDLGAYPRGAGEPVGPTPALFDCIPGPLGDCGDIAVPDPERSDLACGGDCGGSSIPAFPISAVALGALALGLVEAIRGRRDGRMER